MARGISGFGKIKQPKTPKIQVKKMAGKLGVKLTSKVKLPGY